MPKQDRPAPKPSEEDGAARAQSERIAGAVGFVFRPLFLIFLLWLFWKWVPSELFERPLGEMSISEIVLAGMVFLGSLAWIVLIIKGLRFDNYDPYDFSGWGYFAQIVGCLLLIALVFLGLYVFYR